MENKKIEGSETLLNKAKEITEKCRKLGLANGAALGHHSGFADEVADCIDNLLHRIAELEKYKMLPTKASKIFKTPSTTFPNGDEIYASVAEGEAVDVYRVNPNGDDERLCFVELNPNDKDVRHLMVGAYRNDREDTVYYERYDQVPQ